MLPHTCVCLKIVSFTLFCSQKNVTLTSAAKKQAYVAGGGDEWVILPWLEAEQTMGFVPPGFRPPSEGLLTA